MPEDIFISYAHIDNEPFGNPHGWVEQFFKDLKVRLPQVLGYQMRIWWDKKLPGDKYIANEIGKQVSSALLLVPVISPRYVSSEWCRGEVTEFCQASRIAEQGNHSRIFKIVKRPVAEQDLPAALRGLSGYLFYALDDKDRPREFRQELSPNKDQNYWDTLDDLVWDIKQAVETLTESPQELATPNALPLEKKIYLAEGAPDVSVERDRIKRELKQHGYYVLPDAALPSDPAAAAEVIRECLARCVLSIHLLGGRYDQRVQEADGSMLWPHATSQFVRLQLDLADHRAKQDDEFVRLLWIPQDLHAQDSRQQELIDELQQTMGAGTELLQTSLQELKLRVIEKLTSRPAARIESRAHRSVYLLHDARDADEVTPIGDFLYSHGFEVIPTMFEGDSADLAQYHRESLLNCSAALLYYGSANHMWLRSKIWDLQKCLGWGRPAPMPAAVYVSAPATAEKQNFRTHDVPVIIQNFTDFSPEKLQPFLRIIENGNGGQRS